MSRYTKEQIERADSLDLAPYLESKGYRLSREGEQYRVEGFSGLYVKGNRWYCFSRKRGGRTVSFLTGFEGIPFPQALRTLLREEGLERDPVPELPKLEHPAPGDLRLPEPAENNDAALAYLAGRGIDPGILNECVGAGLLYQSDMYWKQNAPGEYERKECSPQAVFVGKDPAGAVRYACTRSCGGTEKHDAPGSDKAYAFSLPGGDSRSVWVFESAIDLLSHATLCGYSRNGFPTHRVSLGGVSRSALVQYLTDHPGIRFVNLALDADPAGRDASKVIREMLGSGYAVYDHPPLHGKDWNEDLLFRQEAFREKTRRQPQKER